MYIGRYTDKLLEENRQLKKKIATYESDTALAQMKALCDRRIQGAVDREKRNYDNWMKALEVNKELKKKNTSLWNYFAWVYDFTLPTTNNTAKSGLRMTKTKQKVSGQFLKEETAKEFAAVRTYTETCRKNGINEYEALERLMEGKPYSMQEILAVAH